MDHALKASLPEQNELGGVTRREFNTAGKLADEWSNPVASASLPQRHAEYQHDALGRLRVTIVWSRPQTR